MDNLENIDVSNMDVSTMSKVIERLWPKFLDAGMNIVWAVLILIVGLKLISILRKFLKKTLLRGNVDTGVVQFLDALVKISAWTVLILSLLGHFGIQTTSFITILGSAGVAIGLSLQGSLSNFAGGILILVMKPFQVGHYINACGCEGTVAEISLFCTTLHTVDNRNVVIPGRFRSVLIASGIPQFFCCNTSGFLVRQCFLILFCRLLFQCILILLCTFLIQCLRDLMDRCLHIGHPIIIVHHSHTDHQDHQHQKGACGIEKCSNIRI